MGPLFFMEETGPREDSRSDGEAMNRKEVVAQVEQLLRPIVSRWRLDMVDIQVVGDAQHTILRVLVDRPDGGIAVEECARVNEALGRQLDLYELFAHAYTLEVSSPGLDRPLRTDGDFRRFAGRRAEITALAPIDGQRRFRGMLLGVVGEAVVMQIDGRQVQVPKAQIAQARLVVELEDLRADLKATDGRR